MKKESIRLTVSYATVQFFFWFAYGTALAYASPYLLACGLSNTAIGLINAAACALSVLIQPGLSAYADRESSPSLKVILSAMMGLMLVCNLLLVFMGGKSGWINSLLLGAYILAIQLCLPLVNALATESMNAGAPLNFGIARGFGSFGYAVMSFTMGQLIAWKGVEIHPRALLCFTVCLLVSIQLFPFQKRRIAGGEAPKGQGGFIAFVRRYPVFSITLAGFVLVYVSHVLINNYVYQIVVSKGGDSGNMGITMSLAGFLEVIPMFIFPLLLKRRGSGFWARLSAIFFMLKALGTLLVSSIGGLYLVQLLQPLGWGLLTVSSVFFVNETMQDQDRIKGQAYMTMSLTAATIIGALGGGWMIDTAGVQGMLTAAVICAAAGTCIVWFNRK